MGSSTARDGLQRLRRGRRQNLALLVSFVLLVLFQPVLGHRSIQLGLLFDFLFVFTGFYVFFVVFRARWERRVAFVIVLPALVSYTMIYALLAGRFSMPIAVAYHCSVVMFLGFVVAVILRDIFRKGVISGDDVVGAICGYLIAALAWANLYSLTELLFPRAFTVNAAIAWRLGNWHTRRALFDYVSFTTLTGLGYADVVPTAPPAYSLTWLEVIFGQFYIAVVVAQLVGLKLADALRKSPGP
ncbi:MAG TPA: hypothetical protein VEL75_10665 [Candidatus Methylomirabilis sp.]|nr:hypothetical protein [Candidatus Methylomirabilis sp.]